MYFKTSSAFLAAVQSKLPYLYRWRASNTCSPSAGSEKERCGKKGLFAALNRATNVWEHRGVVSREDRPPLGGDDARDIARHVHNRRRGRRDRRLLPSDLRATTWRRRSRYRRRFSLPIGVFDFRKTMHQTKRPETVRQQTLGQFHEAEGNAVHVVRRATSRQQRSERRGRHRGQQLCSSESSTPGGRQLFCRWRWDVAGEKRGATHQKGPGEGAYLAQEENYWQIGIGAKTECEFFWCEEIVLVWDVDNQENSWFIILKCTS